MEEKIGLGSTRKIEEEEEDEKKNEEEEGGSKFIRRNKRETFIQYVMIMKDVDNGLVDSHEKI